MNAQLVTARSVFSRHQTLALLLLPLLALLLATSWMTPARADDESGTRADERNTMTVGITTATKKGLDDRGNYQYELLPGGLVVDYVSVSNYSLKPVTVRLLARAATSQGSNAFIVQPTNTPPTVLSSWVSIGEPVVKLPPRSTRTVPFQLGVPKGAEPGDYAGAMVMSLMAEGKPRKGEKAEPVAVEHRVALKMMLRVPGQIQPGLEVEDLTAEWDGAWSPTGRGDVRISYTVRNTGNVRLSADPALALDRSFGRGVVTAKGERINDLLPGGALAVEQVVPDVFSVGPLTARVSLQPSGVDRELPEKPDPTTAEVEVAAWWWLLVVALGVLLLLIAAYVVWRRVRKGNRTGDGGPGGRRARRAGGPDTPAAPAAEQAPEAVSVSPRIALRSAGAGAVALVALLIGIAPAAHAEDAETWRATTSTPKGTADVPFEIKTSGGCPAPATNMIAWVTGKGLPKEGAIAISNTVAPAMDQPFVGYVIDSMSNLMASQGGSAQLDGTYTFRLQCITAEHYDHSYGDYVVKIAFSDPTHWRMLPPVTRKTGPHGGSEAGAMAGAGAAGSNGTTGADPAGAGASAGDPSAGGPGAAGADADVAATAAEAAAADADRSTGGMTRTSWSLIGLGVLLLGGVFAWLYASRPQA
ncbi:hypothetical protein [Nocardioides cavernaquae]|uniref:DUF916 domain-containing protein n=1 Tax=Nocardioides cavernaquae TaxID=2321396 RepID=A0A3A5H6A1_9ACTN|nr:hypothetical protein [Nocardioides cavernaquae]RJS46193.1 hypothetical protein D4739_08220 [Nocardioides cavernaquae]